MEILNLLAAGILFNFALIALVASIKSKKPCSKKRRARLALGCCGDIFGSGDSAVSDVKVPEWEADPYYEKTQTDLYGFGSNALAGILPDYYKAIGETQSDEYKAMLNLSNKNIANSVNEVLAKRNIGRGGLGASIASKAIAENTTKLNYADYERALTGKQSILSSALSTLSGVRSGALTNQGQVNAFNQNVFEDQLKLATYEDAQDQSENDMWGNLLKAGISAAAIFASGGLAAPAATGMGAAGGAAETVSLGSGGVLPTFLM